MNGITTLTVYPTTEGIEYFTDRLDHAPKALRDWATTEGFTLHKDPESDATVLGYYVRDMDGRQVAAATITP